MKRCLSLWIYGWLGKIQWTLLPQKGHFESHLNMKDITDTDHAHVKRVCKDF